MKSKFKKRIQFKVFKAKQTKIVLRNLMKSKKNILRCIYYKANREHIKGYYKANKELKKKKIVARNITKQTK